MKTNWWVWAGCVLLCVAYPPMWLLYLIAALLINNRLKKRKTLAISSVVNAVDTSNELPRKVRGSTRKNPEFQNKATIMSDDLFTVTIELGGSPNYAVPKRSGNNKRSSIPDWVPPGEDAEVANLLLRGGMIYVSNSKSRHSAHPSQIIKGLPVSNQPASAHQWQASYWPRYSDLAPQDRKIYLEWLAGGRCDPKAAIGCVFMFFYGLERRLLNDTLHGPEGEAERSLIVAEIERLKHLYGSNNSFLVYSTNLLNIVRCEQINNSDEPLYRGTPPAMAASRHEFPQLLRVALGQMARDKHPLDAHWALAWALSDSAIQRRTAVTRCPELFGRLFCEEYERQYRGGLLLPQNKTRVKLRYQTASQGLAHKGLEFPDLPDIAVTTATRNKMQAIVDLCTSQIEPYSRYLARNADKPGALEGLLTLPARCWPSEPRAQLESIEQQLQSGEHVLIMTTTEIVQRLGGETSLSRSLLMALIRAFETQNIGFEPDVLGGSRVPKPEELVALFLTDPEDGALRSTDAYRAASVTLDLASAVAAADGEISGTEAGLLHRHIDSWGHLTVSHRKRLKAHLAIKLKQPPPLTGLKKKLEPLSPEARRAIAGLLSHLAQSDGEATPAEVKLLEKVYKALSLDVQAVYTDLHGAAGGANLRPVPVQPAATGGSKISDQPAPAAGFALDASRIAQLQQETAEVSSILADVFSDDHEPQAPEPPVADVAESDEGSGGVSLPGLDSEHAAFFRLLLTSQNWSREDLEAIASDMGLMLDGALEQINDATFDAFDIPATEGDGPVEINPELLERLAS